MSAKNRIQRFIYDLEPGQAFTTRELFGLANRSSIYQQLFLYVRSGRIKRVARGVYLLTMPRDEGANLNLTVRQIAEVKARAYGRRLVTHKLDEAFSFKLVLSGKAEKTYSTTGWASSFDSVHGRIHFRQASSRDLHLADSPTGKFLRAIQAISLDKVTADIVRTTLSQFTQAEIKQIRNDVSKMPVWLSDLIVDKSKKYKLSTAPELTSTERMQYGGYKGHVKDQFEAPEFD